MSSRWTDVDGICFDVGGTIVPEEGGSVTAEIAALTSIELSEMRAILSRQAKRTRRSPRQLARELAMEMKRPALEPELEELLLRHRRQSSEAQPYPDAASSLATLRARGFAIAFLSNIVGASAPEAGHPLMQLADVALSSCDTGHVKPEREAFAAAERALGIPAQHMVHVGDSLTADVHGALAAGWRVVFLARTGDTDPLPGDPDRVRGIETLGELIDLLPERAERALPKPTAGELDQVPSPGEWLHVTARCVKRGGRSLLVLPVAAPIGRSRGQLYRISIGGSLPRPRVLFSLGGRAALALPEELGFLADEIDVRLQPVSHSHPEQLPAELGERLRDLGLDAAALPEHELHQLVLMIRESSSKEVRDARIAAAVAAIKARSKSN